MNDFDVCVICGGYREAGGCGTCTCHDDTDEEIEDDICLCVNFQGTELLLLPPHKV